VKAPRSSFCSPYPEIRQTRGPQILWTNGEFLAHLAPIARDTLKRAATTYAALNEQYEKASFINPRNNEIACEMLQIQVNLRCSHIRLLELAHELA
jgi:hypothetical protein